MYKGWLNTALTFLAVVTVLLLTQIIEPAEALHGFANEQLAVIVLLLILSEILKKSPAVNTIFRRVLKPSDKPKWFLTKMMALVGVNSAFFNNTPLVAMMMPYVYEWSKENELSPSKFLIPLSYASILGGCITLVGTSTTLIVNALAVEQGAPALNMFDLTPVGLIMFVLGLFYLLFFGYNMLPNNKINVSYQNKQQQVRQYFMETVVSKESSIVGKTVKEAGLRNLKHLFLVEILKGDTAIRPVGPETMIHANDKLFFAGDLNTIKELDVETLGLSLPKSCDTSTGRRHDMTEVVVSHNSSLIGNNVKSINFRSKYDGAVLAVHRNGERIWGHIADIKLKAGDVLLVMAGRNFQRRIKENTSLYQISNFAFEEEPDTKKILTLFGGMIGAIALAALGLVPLFNSLIVLIILSFITKLAHPKDIKKSIDYNLIVIIGLGLALGTAMEKSGAANLLSASIGSIAAMSNPMVFFFIVFIIVNLLSSVITSKAAVAILIPILLQVTRSMGILDTPVVLLIAFSAAANFITPMGYQTNMMVYGPGRYRFTDFVKVGLPLSLMYMVVCVLALVYYYDLNNLELIHR